jgi:hypothetical protein
VSQEKLDQMMEEFEKVEAYHTEDDILKILEKYSESVEL